MSTTAWSHRVLESPADLDAEPPTMSAKEAQAWSNFVVFAPRHVPADCSLAGSTVRREAPPGRVGDHTAGRTPWTDSNPAAYRLEIVGDRRRIRLKQFLYDWAFPALDHPALWKSETRAVPIDDRHVLWYGRDYKGNPAASARIRRTNIEASVLEGEFTDQELLDVYGSLEPADPGAVEAINRNTPFAHLSYWARHRDAETIAVPLGLWRFHQPPEATLRWHAAGERAARVGGIEPPATLGRLELDSLAEETSGKSWLGAELSYVDAADRNRELRLQMFHEGYEEAPERDAHPGRSETISIDDRNVHLAWIDEQYGPFDAIVDDPGGSLPRQRLLSTTGTGLDRGWFVGALGELIGAQPSVSSTSSA